MAARAYDFEIGDSKIDSKNSTIRQVSLISLGQAKGHETEEGKQIWIDGKTLSQIFDCLTELGSLKVKEDHESGVMSTLGYVDGFEKTGSQILGDLHVYDAEPEKERLFEIAGKNPSHLGLSLEFSGEDEEMGNKAFARCDDVYAVALVSEPAANAALFQKSKQIVDLQSESGRKKSMATKKNLDDAAADPMTEMGKKFDAFCEKYDADMKDRDAKMKRFDDYLNNTDGKGNIDGEGRNIDPKVKSVVSDDDKASAESDTHMDTDDGKKDDDDDAAANAGDKKFQARVDAEVDRRVKAMAAKLGTTRIPSPGVGTGITDGKGTAKTFDAVVAERAKAEFKGDKTKAMQAVLAEVKKGDPELTKLYADSRKKFLKVEPKANRYL
jgi:hypothetical protein